MGKGKERRSKDLLFAGKLGHCLVVAAAHFGKLRAGRFEALTLPARGARRGTERGAGGVRLSDEGERSPHAR